MHAGKTVFRRQGRDLGTPGSSQMAVNRRELTSEHFPSTICEVDTKDSIHEVSKRTAS